MKPTAPVAHSKKPDIDNLIKFYMDAMTGKFYVDDSQVHKIKAMKLYGLENEVEITISNQN